MKKKTLLSSILVIALCLSLIAGSTFALFTSESQVNAAFTAGNVDIVATIDEASIIYWSTLGTTLPESGYTVNTDKNTITLNLMAPGDVLEFDIILTNNSDLTVFYRTFVKEVADKGLWDGLVATAEIEGTTYDAKANDYKVWTSLEAKKAGATAHVRVELPETAGNEYERTSCEFAYIVEAVQGNANLLATTADVQTKLDKGGLISQFNDTMELDTMLNMSAESTTFADITLDGSNIPDADANGENPAAMLAYDAAETNVTLADGAQIIAPDGAGKFGIFYFNKTNTLTIEEGAKIVADGANNACIQVHSATLNLYLADASALEATNGALAIALGAAATLNITVPNATVKAAVDQMIANGLIATNDGTAATINVTIG